jgi:NAD(P)-dependent dehydrogenase (short-subunit alcohol dehydrogenase family)/pimeloyl-ACP methyl ester carboxylesterase
VQSAGVELAVYSWGLPLPHQSVVVLVHGYPDAASVWEKTAEILSEHCFVVSYDVRGAGLSDVPQTLEQFDMGLLLEDLAVVLDTMSPDKAVHLVGHDWGSLQGWEAVTTERLRGRILSYTSVSGPCLDHIGHWLAKRAGGPSPKAIREVARQAAHSWYVGLFHLPYLAPALWKNGLDKLWPGILNRLEGVTGHASETQSGDGAVGVNLYRANVLKRLLNPQDRRADIPVQLIVPRKDPFIIPQIFDDLPQWVDQLWRRDVEAGHWLQVSHPQLMADWVIEFIKLVDGGQQSAALARARDYASQSGKVDAGKLVVITGAASGFGRETALRYAQRGANVVAVDINQEGVEQTAQLCSQTGARAWARQVDVSSGEQMTDLAQWVGQNFGAPDIVVNNAGIGMAGSFFDTTDEEWKKVLDINLWGVIRGSRLFGEQMIAAGKKGHIVNVASMGGFTPIRFMSAYNTTKAAVMMLSDCLRGELAGKGIHVSTICPGMANTGITQRTRFVGTSESEEQAQRSKVSRLYELRNLKTETVAQAIVQAVEKRQDEVLVGIEAHGSRMLGRLLPAVARRLARLNPVS